LGVGSHWVDIQVSGVSELKVLHVNVFDVYGGGETIMRRLCEGLIQSGNQSGCLVRQKNEESHPYPVEIFRHDEHRPLWCRNWIGIGTRLMEGPGKSRMWVRGLARFLMNEIGQPKRTWKRKLGWEDFDFPDTEAAMRRFSFTPDLIHIHCFHGKYFDLRQLESISQWRPVVVTLHDPWMFTGHCAYPGSCERFKVGCGACPDLKRYPAISRDASASNFARKREIYCRSEMHLAAPSRWMMNQLEASALGDCFKDKRVIPNGIDTSEFTPGDSLVAREQWQLDPAVPVLLYVARNARSSPYKDFGTIKRSMRAVVDELRKPIQLLVLGESGSEEIHGSLRIRFELTTNSQKVVAAYRAADIYLHAAAAENFPTTVLEAMACGTPVVATRTGGIPEQVIEAQTGHLVESGDHDAMTSAILKLLKDEARAHEFGSLARQKAVQLYDQSVMSERYLEWYKQICCK